MRAFSSCGEQNNNPGTQALPPKSDSLIHMYIHPHITYRHICAMFTHELTIASAVMDSFIQRFSSSKWPTTIQAQIRATKRFIETTEE